MRRSTRRDTGAHSRGWIAVGLMQGPGMIWTSRWHSKNSNMTSFLSVCLHPALTRARTHTNTQKGFNQQESTSATDAHMPKRSNKLIKNPACKKTFSHVCFLKRRFANQKQKVCGWRALRMLKLNWLQGSLSPFEAQREMKLILNNAVLDRH